MNLPEMHFADDRCGNPYSKDPAVVRLGERYLMYYSVPPRPDSSNGGGWSIGVAESSDLTHWKPIGSLLPEQDCERSGICAPGVIVLSGKVHLFYQTYGNGVRDAICHAESWDGIHFQRNPHNPVFRPKEDWNNGRAIDADVVAYKGKLLLFFATRDPSSSIQMLGVAETRMDGDFSPSTWRELASESILRPELPWEGQCIEAPAVVEIEGRLVMFYAGAYNNMPQQIGCAVSDDAVHWERLSDSPFLPNGRPGSWNHSESGHPFIFSDRDGRTHLFYQGNPDNGKTWHLSRVEIFWEGEIPRLEEPLVVL